MRGGDANLFQVFKSVYLYRADNGKGGGTRDTADGSVLTRRGGFTVAPLDKTIAGIGNRRNRRAGRTVCEGNRVWRLNVNAVGLQFSAGFRRVG